MRAAAELSENPKALPYYSVGVKFCSMGGSRLTARLGFEVFEDAKPSALTFLGITNAKALVL